jgi:hypothetical protein
MFLTTIVLLFLLPCSILAKSIPRASTDKHHDKRTGCHDYTHLMHELLTFRHPSDDYYFDYAIYTRHWHYYPQLLRHALKDSGFQNTYLHADELCGWKKAKSVHYSMGLTYKLHRGDIYWKYSDLRWVTEPKHSNVSSHWAADDESHMPPSTGLRPYNATIDAIEWILKDNDPAADVYEIATFVLGYWAALTGFIVLMCLFMACMSWVGRMGRSAMPTTWDDDSDAIELDAIKTPDSQIKAAPRKEGEAPKYSFEDTCHASASSTDTLRSEPLPIYSVDGAGR